MRNTQVEREALEKQYYIESSTEGVSTESIDLDLLTYKMWEARAALEGLARHEAMIRNAGTILELGAGEGWLSCILKRKNPSATIVASDISWDGIASNHRWAKVLAAQPDAVLACRSYEIPLADSSVDLVIVFSAGHHFGAQRRSLAEIYRVIRPGGAAVYMHEPTCPALLHKIAYRRVNAKRPAVVEDVLRFKKIAELGRSAGFGVDVVFAPTTTCRAPLETLYYSAHRRLRWLNRMLPCTADFVFTKPTNASISR